MVHQAPLLLHWRQFFATLFGPVQPNISLSKACWPTCPPFSGCRASWRYVASSYHFAFSFGQVVHAMAVPIRSALVFLGLVCDISMDLANRREHIYSRTMHIRDIHGAFLGLQELQTGLCCCYFCGVQANHSVQDGLLRCWLATCRYFFGMLYLGCSCCFIVVMPV